MTSQGKLTSLWGPTGLESAAVAAMPALSSVVSNLFVNIGSIVSSTVQ